MNPTEPFHENSRFLIPESVVTEEVAGELVILDLTKEGFFSLDPVGTRVWQLVSLGHSVSEVLYQMMEEYDVDRDRLTSDVASLLGQLLERQLIEEPQDQTA